MKFEIKHRFNGKILFSMETETMKLTLEAAVKSDADLGGVDLSGAYLSGTNLSGAKGGPFPIFITSDQYGFQQANADGSVLRSGCIEKPLDWWVENIRRTAERHNYTPRQVDEYEVFVEMFAKIAEIRKKHATPTPESEAHDGYK